MSLKFIRKPTRGETNYNSFKSVEKPVQERKRGFSNRNDSCETVEKPVGEMSRSAIRKGSFGFRAMEIVITSKVAAPSKALSPAHMQTARCAMQLVLALQYGWR